MTERGHLEDNPAQGSHLFKRAEIRVDTNNTDRSQ